MPPHTRAMAGTSADPDPQNQPHIMDETNTHIQTQDPFHDQDDETLPNEDLTPSMLAGTRTDGITPKIQNVVATVNLNCRLDLVLIAQQARNAEYQPKRFAAVIMRIRQPATTALIFASGKMVVTGAKSIADSKLASRKFARTLQKLGYRPSFTEYKVQNIVGAADVRFDVRLEGLAREHGQFAGMKPKVVLLIFVSGKVNLTGAKTKAELFRAFELIYPVLKGLRFKRPEIEKAKRKGRV